MAFGGSYLEDSGRFFESMGVDKNVGKVAALFTGGLGSSYFGRQQRKAEQAEQEARAQARREAQAKQNKSVEDAFSRRRQAFDGFGTGGNSGMSPGQKNASMGGTMLSGNNQTQQLSIMGGE